MSGRVTGIHLHVVGKGEPLETVDRVRAVAGEGLEGDRYRSPDHPREEGRQLTLVEAEALELLRERTGIELEPWQTRRNVMTRGVDLNALVGRRFRVGETECEGIEPCHPCRHLERVTEQGVLKGLAGRGGLRANVLKGGQIAVGDAVEPC